MSDMLIISCLFSCLPAQLFCFVFFEIGSTYARYLLLSGMRADARVFARQMEEIPRISVPAWIPPRCSEPLADYAARFAKHVDLGRRCYVGGASFGGFVALELVRHLNVEACFLIGSVRGPEEFPAAFRAVRRLAWMSDMMPFEAASALCSVVLLCSDRFWSRTAREIMVQLAASDSSFLRWACRAALEWKGMADMITVPVHQIHGKLDMVLPAANTSPDCIVAGAGHAVSISHPQAVTQFLRKRMQTEKG